MADTSPVRSATSSLTPLILCFSFCFRRPSTDTEQLYQSNAVTSLLMTQRECNTDKIIKYLSELQTQLSQIPLSKKATLNNNEQPREIVEKKRRSCWARFRERFKKTGKVKRESSNHASDSGGSLEGSTKIMRNIDENQEEADFVIRKLQSDIYQMIAALKNLTEFQTHTSKLLESDLRSITKLCATLQKTDSIRTCSHDIEEFRRKLSTLKCRIPSSLFKLSSKLLSIRDSQTTEEIDEIDETGDDIYLPGIHVFTDFKYSTAFEEVMEKLQGLDFPQKLCLLSFAVFPENRKVTRTMLMYWWIGEGFISCEDSENSVTRILHEFLTKRLLEPVEDERKLNPSSYRMEPHVHSAVMHLAKSGNLFKLYSPEGNLIMEKSLKEKVCLVKGSSLLRKAKKSVMKPENLTTVFNSSERYPDFTFKWFPVMKSLRVLYLGRWERTNEHQIEVERTGLLKDMKTMKNLRLVSFRGILGIEKFDDSICMLKELVILDLRACYDLQVLPPDIGLLENLVYLDASECLRLHRMPKEIEKLTRLQVLKGFVISETDHENECAVKQLLNLRKLSITVNKYSFTVESLMKSLTDLKQLESLKIAWGARFPGRGWHENQAIDDTSKLPSSLKKLKLEAYPHMNLPSLLNPKNLGNLEKLCIRGGNLCRISKEHPTAGNNCRVQILRLKYLHKFRVEWKDLQALFPKMILLEKYECPKVAFCPTDGNGVWRKPHISPNM